MAQDTCSICLEPLIQLGSDEQNKNPIGAATCGHCYHVDCFWSWEQAKREQDWRSMRSNGACPCPICNRPVMEFTRLYLCGDKSEVDRLTKELKSAKKKLAKERSRLQNAQAELEAAALARQRAAANNSNDRSISAPRPRQTGTRANPFACSSESNNNDDIQALCAAVRMLLYMPPSPPAITATNGARPPAEAPPSRSSCRLEEEAAGDLESLKAPRTSAEPDLVNGISLPPPPSSSGHHTRNSNSRTSSRRSDSTNNYHGGSRDATRSSTPTRDAARSSAAKSRSRSRPPRPDPVESVHSDTTRQYSNMSRRFSELLWFPGFEPPSCGASVEDVVVDPSRPNPRNAIPVRTGKSRSDPPQSPFAA